MSNNLGFHAAMARAAGLATLERVRAGCLHQELNRCCFPLLKLPTLLGRDKIQPRFAAQFGAVGNGRDFESMVVVRCGDFELNFGPRLDVNR